MRTLYIFLITLIGYTSSAQDPQLFENTWYLQNVIIDGQDNFPPSNDEVPYVPLMIYENNMHLETSVCNVGSGNVEFSLIDSSFFFTNGMALTIGNCQNPDNSPFEGIYFWDFFNSGYITVNDVFSYEIIDAGNGDYTLTITSPSENQAVYGNQILGNTDFKESQFAIYPNPASEQLTLTSKNANETIEVQIFNVEGKLLGYQNLNIQNGYILDVSQLSSGLYFLNIKDENGNVGAKKFIKE